MLVANAAEVPGAAGRLADRLAELGFVVDDPTDAAGNEQQLDVSKVYYKPGAEAVANQIATLMGGIVVAPMPTPIWIAGGPGKLGFSTIVIMLGKDRAETPLPGLAAG